MMHKHTDTTYRIAFGGVFLALALILSYVEALIPFNFGIPGIKLGLANLIVLLALYKYSPYDAIAVNILRILIVSILFTDFYSFLYSLSGALLSFLIMVLLYRIKKLSVVSVSVCGGVCHNIGQLLVALFVTKVPHLLFYLPVLVISGVITGLLIGLLARILIPVLTRTHSDNRRD